MTDLSAPDAYHPLVDPFAGPRGGELVLFDLEFTAWEGSRERGWSEPWEAREPIQIGAVRVRDDGRLTETNRLLCFVQPLRNPALSDYITDLTGIRQEVIDEEGFDFPEALEIFVDFCEGARAVLTYSGDAAVLAEACAIHKTAPPDWTRFGELSGCLGLRAGEAFATSSSFELPALAGLAPEGRAHDALDDALALARTLRALRKKGCL
jgi:inhibitor of KinA sporulation pathway (predicted exonuclease)